MNIIETNLSFTTLSKRKSTTRLILHHTATSSETVEQIHEYHKNQKKWAGIGYHFYVRKDGSVYRGRPEDTVGAHATGNNSDSIGVCFEGNFETETMPDAQKAAGCELVAYLKQKYGISTVQRHKDVCATSCPGTNFPFDEIVRATGQTEQQTESQKPTQTNYCVRINTKSGVNVRTGAGETYEKITAVKNGEEVTITQELNGWGFCVEKGGWICLKYTQKIENAVTDQPAKETYIKNDKVRVWQEKMNIAFNGEDRLEVDGSFGPASQAFANKHQIYKGIKHCVTGVKWVQAQVGVNQDGSFGPDTHNAVVTYQKNHGLKANGYVGLETTTAMLR